MTTYYADMVSCEGTVFVAETEATSRQAADDYFSSQYEDARIEGVYTREEVEEREAERYRKIELRYDRDEYDLY